jgi:hypothetical protein
VKSGVPFQTAFEMEDLWADALGIAFGEFAGGEWDWEDMSWREVKS